MSSTRPADGEGFTKAERLRKRREFLRVQRGGRRFHTPLFVVIWRPGIQPWTRLGITASRKVGNAVQRNRAKRLIREAFRRNKANLPRGVDMVVIASRRLPRASYQEVEAALRVWAEET